MPSDPYPPWSNSLPPSPAASPPPSHPSRYDAAEPDALDDEDVAFLTRVSRSGTKLGAAQSLYDKATSLPPRHLAGAGLALLLLASIWHTSSRPSGPMFLPSPGTYFDSTIPFFDFNATADSEALPPAIARSLRLTYSQCDVAFPALWPQLEQRRDDQKNEGGVTENQLDAGGGGARVALIGGDLFVRARSADLGIRPNVTLTRWTLTR